MAPPRKIYRGSLVEGASIPSVDFSQFKVQASGFDSLTQRLDAINTFAIKGLNVEMEEAGKQYAAENPLSVDQFYKANPTDRNNIIGGNKVTTYGKAIRATHINILSSDLAIKAQKDFMDLKIEAHILKTKGTPMSLDMYKNKLDGIVNGYSEALLPVDADASVTTQAKLATTANSYYTSYADDLIKDHKKRQTTEAIIYGNDHIERISDIVKLGPMVEVQVGTEVVTIPLDQYLDAEKIRIQSELSAANISTEQMTQWETKWDAEVIQQKKNYLYSTFVNTEDNINKGVEHQAKVYAEIRKGNFYVKPELDDYPPDADLETKKEIDAANDKKIANAQKQAELYKSIYDSLDADEKKEFRDTVQTWADNGLKAEEGKEKGLAVDKKTIVEDLEFKYAVALSDNDYLAAEKIVEEMKDLDPKSYITYSASLKEDKRTGEFNDADEQAELYESLYFGTLEKWEIKNAYDIGVINQNTRDDLLVKVISAKKEGFSEADAYIRRQVGYADVTMFGDAGKEQSQAHKLYIEKVGELYDWLRANPNSSKNAIMDKAIDIVGIQKAEDQKVTDQTNFQNKISNQMVVIGGKKQKGYDMSGPLWMGYFNGEWQNNEMWKQGYKHDNFRDTFLTTPGGVDMLIDEMEELRDLINTGNTTYTVKGMLWGTNEKQIALPQGVDAAHITNIISDLKILKGHLQ